MKLQEPPKAVEERLLYQLERDRLSGLKGLLASGITAEEILKMYPYLQHEDIMAALSYAAWRSEEIEVPLATA